MSSKEEVSILHPLAGLEWEGSTQLPKPMYDAQCVVLHDTLYVGGGDTQSECDTMLFASPTESIQWTTHATPTMFYALSTYNSHLVLIGGIETDSRQITNKLWSSASGVDWRLGLPAMPTKRYSSSAVNTVSPECLVVAGGGGDNLADSDTVEVLDSGVWWTVQPLPRVLSDMKPTLHAGKLYLMGGVSQGTDVYFCDVHTLTSWNQQPQARKECLWNHCKVNSPRSCSASFGKHLLSIGGGGNRVYSSDIVAFSPITEAWVHVGEVPIPLCDAACIVIPSTQTLVMVGGRTATRRNARVYTATLRASSYDPNYSLSMSGLCKLEEGAGIKVVSSLANIPSQFASSIGVDLPAQSLSKSSCVESIVGQWKLGDTKLPPTWKSLLTVLKDLDLENLCQAIEDYMHGVQSLQELCCAVIKSALLQQESLEADHLLDKLPNYVSTRIKHLIIRNYTST